MAYFFTFRLPVRDIQVWGCEIRIKYGKAKECELEKLPLLINQEGKKISLTSDFWISFLSKWNGSKGREWLMKILSKQFFLFYNHGEK